MKYLKVEVMQLVEQLRIGQKITRCYNGSREKSYTTYTGKVTQIESIFKYFVLGDFTVGYVEIDVLTIPKY